MSGFRRTKLKTGAALQTADSEGDVAVLVSGHVRAYLGYGDQEIAVFNAERGFPILTTSGLVLRARRDSELLVAPRAVFFEIAMSTPDMLWPMYTAVERMLAQTLRIVEGIRFLDVRARLVLYIIGLCEDHGQAMQDGIAIPFEHTIEEVANEIGSTRPTTSQILNRLIKEKFVRRLSRKQLLVPDLDRLRKTLSNIQQTQTNATNTAVCEVRIENCPLLQGPSQEAAEICDAAPVLYRRATAG
jgi:CRP-like cAMP-binding protein